MENASRALVMAGGIFIALLIIGALLLMFNQLGAYQKANTSSEKDSQLAEFNAQFTKYAEETTIQGTDLVSLANKVIDYNKKAEKGGITNSVNYDIKMTLEVINMQEFRNKYGYTTTNDALFKEDTYSINANNNENALQKALNSFNNADRALLRKVSSIYDKYEKRTDKEKNIKKYLIEEIDEDTYKDWDFTKYPDEMSIKHYKEYSEFKTSTFKIDGNPIYTNGQITKLVFKFSK